jgi:hypothetical protein
LGPYREADALATIQQIEAQKHIVLDTAQRNWVYRLSGGHPGVIRALIDVLSSHPPSHQLGSDEYLTAQPRVKEEFRKLLASLQTDEQTFLKRKVENDPDPGRGLHNGVQDILRLKGLIVNNTAPLFSPLFARWLRQMPAND